MLFVTRKVLYRSSLTRLGTDRVSPFKRWFQPDSGKIQREENDALAGIDVDGQATDGT